MINSCLKRARIVVIGVMICISSIVYAAGRTGFPIAKTLMNARSLALGGAPIAVREWGSGASLNPAMAAGSGNTIAVSYAAHTLDLWSGMVFFSAEIKPKMNGGIFLSSFDYGSFEASERNIGLTGENFEAGEYIFSGFVAGNLTSNVDLGISVKYLWGNIKDQTAAGMSMDVGAIWNTGWENVNLAVAVRNMGRLTNYYGTDSDPLPTELLMGGSRRIKHLPLTIHSVIIASQTGEEDWKVDALPGTPGIGFGVGGEFMIVTERKNQPMFIRMGYRSRGQGLQMGHRLDPLAGFSFGIGLNIKNINIDYTFAPMGALGDVHRFFLESDILSKVL